MKLKTILFLTLTLSFTSCGEKSNDKNDKETEIVMEELIPLTTPSASMTVMQMQKWEMTDGIYKGNGYATGLEKKPYLIFREGRASGFAGCNSYVGEYEEGENSGLNFNNIAATKKHCKEATLEEARFLELLKGAVSYTLNEDQTKLNIKSTKGELHFQLR